MNTKLIRTLEKVIIYLLLPTLFLLGVNFLTFFTLDSAIDKNKIVELENLTYQLAKEQYRTKIKLEKSNEFTKILNEIDPNDYDPDTNNCYDHSKALQKKLLAAGIESSIFIRDDREHAWVGVWIEATDGKFVKPNSGWNILEVRDHSLKTVCE